MNGRRKRRVNISTLEEMLSVKPNVSVLKCRSTLAQCTCRSLFVYIDNGARPSSVG